MESTPVSGVQNCSMSQLLFRLMHIRQCVLHAADVQGNASPLDRYH